VPARDPTIVVIPSSAFSSLGATKIAVLSVEKVECQQMVSVTKLRWCPSRAVDC